MKKTKKKKTKTEILREDNWKIRFIVLAVVFFAFIIFTMIYYSPSKTSNPLDEEFCLRTQYTPSWYLSNKTLLGYGLINTTINFLIENEIYFVYSSLCGACEKQIELFGEDWEKYKNSDLTIDCYEVMKQ